MLCSLVRLVQTSRRAVANAVTGLVRHLADRASRAWRSHGMRVAADPTYAAVIAIVLGGVLGVVPPKEVLAAAVAAALGVVMTGRQRPDSDPRRDGHRCNDDVDLI